MAPSASVDTETLNSSATGNSNEDEKTMPYQGAQPFGMPDDLVIPNVMELDKVDERLWVNDY
jgi:hypothetical protein